MSNNTKSLNELVIFAKGLIGTLGKVEGKELLAEAYLMQLAAIQTRASVPTCAICKGPCNDGYGHNPEPLPVEGRVCGDCNSAYVIPIRLANLCNQ